MKSKFFITASAAIVLIGSPLAIKTIGNSALAENSASAVLTDGVPVSAETSEVDPILEADVAAPTEAETGDSKEMIWHKMLNTVDYFDSVSGSFIYTISDINDVYEVTFNTDLNTSEAFSKISKIDAKNINSDSLKANADISLDITKTNTFEMSLYSDGENYYNINNTERAYTVDSNAVIKRENSVAEDDSSRYFIGDDGIPCYSYRADSTNAYLAKSCIFPQEMAFGFLTDLSLWEIADEDQYLGRECYIISGKTAESYGQKIGVSNFEFYVDKATGVLLKYNGYDLNGQLCDFLTATDISFDSSNDIAAPDFQNLVME